MIKGSTRIGRITPENEMPIAAIPKATPAFASNQFATSLVTDKLPSAGPPMAIKDAKIRRRKNTKLKKFLSKFQKKYKFCNQLFN